MNALLGTRRWLTCAGGVGTVRVRGDVGERWNDVNVDRAQAVECLVKITAAMG